MKGSEGEWVWERGKLFLKEFPLSQDLPSSQLSQIALRSVGVDGVIESVFADGDEIADVAIAERAGWKVSDEIVEVADNEKMLPSLCDGDRNTTVDHARAAESKADEVVAQIGAMIIDKLMAEDGEGGTVAVSCDPNTSNGGIGDQRGNMRLYAFPALQKSRVALPRRLHFLVRGGVKGQIVQPIARAVAGLEVDTQLISASCKIPARAHVCFPIGSGKALRKQYFQSAFFHGATPFHQRLELTTVYAHRMDFGESYFRRKKA